MEADNRPSEQTSNQPNLTTFRLSDGMRRRQAQKQVKSQAHPSQKRTRIATGAVLLTELLERLTYFSVVANLIVYTTHHLKFQNAVAVNINLLFTGFLYFIPMVGGYIADVVSGRFNAIYGSTLIYAVGTVALWSSAIPYDDIFGDRSYALSLDSKRCIYLTGLSLIAIGTGGMKSNIGPFGAMQVTHLGPTAVQTFFNWFMWFINLGAAISYLGVVYIQQEISFALGYLVPVLTMVLGIVVFAAPKKIYLHQATGGNAMRDFFLVYKSALVNRFFSKTSLAIRDRSISHVVDYSSFGSNETVRNVKRMSRILPIFATTLIFWTCYYLMSSTFLLQGERLNLNITSYSSPNATNIRLPVASINLFNTFSILVVTPVLDRLIYPLLETRLHVQLSKLKRMGFGMLLASTALVSAAILEICRKKDIAQTGGWYQTMAGKSLLSSSISVFAQIPQVILVGMSEIFTSCTALEFAFSEAPVTMKSAIMGVFFITSGIGSFCGSIMVSIVKASTDWMSNDINEGHLENFFFLMAGLILANFVLLYLPVTHFYRYVGDQDNAPANAPGTTNATKSRSRSNTGRGSSHVMVRNSFVGTEMVVFDLHEGLEDLETSVDEHEMRP